MGRADWVPSELMGHILAALMPENARALRVSVETGLRIDDVLSIRRCDLEKGQRFTIHEKKTGKARRVYLSKELHSELFAHCGRFWAFEGRLDPKKHRSRQAVNKDLERAAKAFRVPARVQISPHSARKIYAAEVFGRTGDIHKVQALLNHSRESVTILYALADAVYKRKMGDKS